MSLSSINVYDHSTLTMSKCYLVSNKQTEYFPQNMKLTVFDYEIEKYCDISRTST